MPAAMPVIGAAAVASTTERPAADTFARARDAIDQLVHAGSWTLVEERCRAAAELDLTHEQSRWVQFRLGDAIRYQLYP